MITFKPIIITSGRHKDGTFPVYIRITQKGVVRRIPTTLAAGPSDLTRSLKLKSPDILDKAGELIRKMRATLADVSPFLLETWDTDQVVTHIRDAMTAQTFHLDFFTFADEYLKTKRPETAHIYRSALGAFERFLGRREIDVNAITKSQLLEFLEYVDNEPKMARNKARRETFATKIRKTPHGASYRYTAKLAHIYEAAKDRYNDEDTGRILIPRSPFSKVPKKQAPSQGQIALEDEVLVRIFRAVGDTATERTALDVFRLSFLLMGANLADLYRAQPFTGGEWRYNRKKTETRRTDRAAMRVEILPEAEPYIAALKTGPKGWWLPALHRLANTSDGCTTVVNRALRSWAQREEIPPFTFYAARHSWATIARRLGVEKATVDECLCHKGDFAVTDIYAERAWHLMTEANKKVIAYIYERIAGFSST